jgi:hypothetical protein
MDFKDVKYTGVECIELAQDRVRWWALAYAERILWVP